MDTPTIQVRITIIVQPILSMTMKRLLLLLGMHCSEVTGIDEIKVQYPFGDLVPSMMVPSDIYSNVVHYQSSMG